MTDQSRYRGDVPATLLAAVLAVGCGGCGDDVSCPDDTVLVGGACVAADGDGGTDPDMAECVPSGDETCNGADEDCDGMVDEGLETMAFFVDDDGDGFGDTAVVACGELPGIVSVGGDCDDGDADVNPDATETCNGVDDDCDGGVDDGLLRAGTPVDLGIEGFVLAKQNLIPYGDGYFCAYYDAPGSQGLYFVVDREGSVTAGPLRITGQPVNDFLIFAAKIDDERIAIVWPQEDTGGDFDLWGRVLDPGSPTEHTDPRLVLPDLVGIPGVAVLDDRLVVWETPPPFEPSDAPGRALSYDLAFEDGMGPVSIDRPSTPEPLDIAFVGALGDEDGYLSLSKVDGVLQPVDPATLATEGERQDASGEPVLVTGAPMEAFYAGEGAGETNYVAAYYRAIEPDGTSELFETTVTDLPLSSERAQFGSTHHAGPVVAVMACYDTDAGGDADGECRYQFAEADRATPISDAQPLTSPTEQALGFPRLASNGDHLAAVVHDGDFAAGPPSLYFVPFTCPAP